MKILIAGVGGQGAQTAAQAIAKAAFREGKKVLYIPNFGVEQRGGASIAFVTVSDKPVVYPKFRTADILGLLSDKIEERIKRYQGPKTKVIKEDDNLLLLKQILTTTKVVQKETVKEVLKEKLGARFDEKRF